MGKAAHIADKNAKRMSEAFNGVNSTIRTLVKSVGAYASVDLFVGLIANAIDAQDKLKDLSKSTALSVETLAGLGTAALKSGGDLESIAASINKLSVNMGKESARFAAIGISAKDPIEAFKQLADVFVAIKDPQERAAFAAEALGKSWAGAAPLLAEGGRAIGEMVEKGTALSKVTAESAAKADELNDMLVDLKTVGGSLTTQFANFLVPSLLATARAMDEILRTGAPFSVLMSSLGQQRLSFDPDFASAANQIKDLEEKLTSLLSQKAKFDSSSGGWINELLIGKPGDIERDIQITKNQIDALKKYGDVLKKPAAVSAPSGPAPDVSGFINDKKTTNSGSKERVVELTASTREYQNAMESLTSAMQRAQSETLGLDKAQETLHKLMKSDEWSTYSDAMKWAAIEQASFTSGALSAADAQSKLNAMLADTPTAKLEKARSDMQLLAEAFKLGQISAEEFNEAASARLGLTGEINEQTKAVEKQKTAAEELGMSFSSAFEDAVVGGKKFSDVLDGLYQDILRIMVRKNITEPLAESIKGFDFAGMFSANALGNVYSSPSLSAYSGQVVNRPTPFMFASGAGIMGEAGPEAIMPLKRGKDGKLGIAGGGEVTVNVINNANGTQATQQTRQDAGGKTIIDVMIETVKGAIASDIGSGGMVAGAMESQYGLNRAAGAWR